MAIFAVAGVVQWGPASLMIAGAVLGGYGGAALARRVDPARVRRVVVALAEPRTRSLGTTHCARPWRGRRSACRPIR